MTMADLIRLAKERRKAEMNRKCIDPVLDDSKECFLLDLCEKVISPQLEPQICSIRGIFLANEFLSECLAEKIFDHLEFLEKSGRFVQLRGRRCVSLGGTVTPEGLLVTDNIPPWLRELMSRIGKPLNHALINIYEPGEGILAHEDGPAYSPYALILSLGSASVFDFLDKAKKCVQEQFFLPVGSLLMFQEEAYSSVFHQYAARREDVLSQRMNERLGSAIMMNDKVLQRGKRISITLRHVRNFR